MELEKSNSIFTLSNSFSRGEGSNTHVALFVAYYTPCCLQSSISLLHFHDCILSQLQNPFNYVSYKDAKAIRKDLKGVYTTINAVL